MNELHNWNNIVLHFLSLSEQKDVSLNFIFFQFNNMMLNNSNDNILLFLPFCIYVYVYVLLTVLHMSFWQGYSFLEVLQKTARSKRFFMMSSEQLLWVRSAWKRNRSYLGSQEGVHETLDSLDQGFILTNTALAWMEK